MNRLFPAATGGTISLILLSLTPSLSRAQTGEALGRLFFTPEERQTLDAQRRADNHFSANTGGREGLRIDGIVVGDNRRTTLWINGRPLVDDPKTRRPLIRADAAAPSKIVIQYPTFPPLRTHVGAQLDATTIKAIPPLEAWVQNSIGATPEP